MASSSYDYFGTAERYTLSNGLTVVLKPVDYARSFSAQVWVRAGSLYEDETNNGLSHLLEHMLFKGTEKYSGRQINHLIESVGGRQNAGTSKDYTNYHVTLPASHWERSLTLLEQMSFHATFPEEEFTKERRVVLSELARYQDNPKRLLWLRFVPMLYEDHPYRQTTIGRESVLRDVTLEETVNYYNRFYRPGRMSLVVTGKFPEDEVRSTIEDLFGDESKDTLEQPNFPDIKPPSGTSIDTETRPINQSYGLIGTTGVSMGSGQTIALDALMEIFGGGRDSRLYETLVLEENLASSISASYWTQQETGPIMVRFQTTRNVNRVTKRIQSIAEDLANKITDDELERAKTSIKTDFVYTAQSVEGQARQLGYWETIGSLDYLERYVDRLESLEKKELKALAQNLLVDQGWRGTVFVPSN